MGTIALFITVFILLCLFALIFVCYRAGHGSREEEEDEETGVMQRATYVLSIVPGSAASSGIPVQSYSSQRARVSFRKTPTPPTIIRNLPCMVWDRPKAAAVSKDTAEAASSEDSECMCVICCCEYEAGEQIKLLPCLHMYHQLCIDAWLGRSHVCPVCQADVVRAAGLSAATGDWSVHTQLAVNQISGVQQQQHLQQQAGDQVVTTCDDSTPQQQHQQQQQQHVTAPVTPEPEAPQPSVSSPVPADPGAAGPATAGLTSPAAGGSPTATAAATAATPAAAGDAYSQRVSSGSSGHSSDAIALVVAAAPAAAAAGSCSGGSIAATPGAAGAVTPLTRV